ncbi:MAG TPA: hypothetical protein VEX60_13265 [Pyrinomonadaceae bacterium]|nr:hypothetical protein [Pyrinomonadaceae bacterium]
MGAASATLALERRGGYRAILWGGLLAGIGDILFAFIFYWLRNGISPVRILQSIASGLVGAQAREGGLATAALGAVLHFLIALTAAAVYYAASRKLGFLVRQAVPFGLLYGIVVYVVMNFVVLPLSAFPGKGTPPLDVMIPGIIAHMLVVGLPIALAVRRYSR